MAKAKVGRLIAAVLILIGAVLLIAALLTPWYAFKTSTPAGSETQNTYPGLPSTNGSIQYSCSGLASCPSQTSYNNARLNNTGNIAETGFFLLIVGIVLGVVAAIFGFAARGNTRRSGPALALGVVALLLALITPVLFAAALPGAISNDIPTAQRPPATGPWSSFIGSSSFTEPFGTVSLNWGPAIGWYLCIAAFVILLVGVIVFFRYRKDPPAPMAAAPSMAPAQASPPS